MKSTSLQKLSSISSSSLPLYKTVDALEVYTTRFTVLEFKHAFKMPSAPLIDLWVTISSGSLSSKSTGVAT